MIGWLTLRRKRRKASTKTLAFFFYKPLDNTKLLYYNGQRLMKGCVFYGRS